MTNPALALTFLSALESPDAEFTFQTIPEAPGCKAAPRVVHGTLAECIKSLRADNEAGCGVFVTVNRTDGKGRRAANITRLRALFVDKDDGELVGAEPDLLVTSARGQHGYWLLMDGDPLEAFAPAQRHLAAFYSSDPVVHDLPRVMRLPGFLHVKGEPFLVDCDVRCGLRRTIADVLAAHPLPERTAPAALGLSSAHAPNRATASVPVGQRNGHLVSLAGSMRRRGMGEDAILAALLAEAGAFVDPPCQAGRGEIEAIARSVARYEPDPVTVVAEGLPLTETGNAERLVRRFGDRVRHISRWNRWIAWDGARWTVDGGDAVVQRFAKETVRGLDTEVVQGVTWSDEDRTLLRKWASKSESASGREAMVRLARHEPAVATSHDAFDADPWLLNVPDGTVDLRTGVMRPHDPRDLLTKLAGVTPSRASGAGAWSTFLQEVTCGDAALESYLQRAVGYTLTGVTREQCLFFLYGGGANGKSTFVTTIMAALGEYACPGDHRLLLSKRGETHPTDRAALFGARLVTVPEVEQGSHWDEPLLKTLTGDDPVNARRMREDFWAFRPTHKFWVTGNSRPATRGQDEALWRRLRLVPFNATFAQRDTNILPRLRAELPAVLAWAIDGCLAWQREGLCAPEPVRAATAAYRETQDHIGQFLRDYTVADPEGRVKRSDLRRAYEHWCDREGDNNLAFGAKRFTEDLRRRGIQEIRSVSASAPHWVYTGFSRFQSRVNEAGWRGLRVRTEGEMGADVPSGDRPN